MSSQVEALLRLFFFGVRAHVFLMGGKLEILSGLYHIYFIYFIPMNFNKIFGEIQNILHFFESLEIFPSGSPQKNNEINKHVAFDKKFHHDIPRLLVEHSNCAQTVYQLDTFFYLFLFNITEREHEI